MLQAKNTFVAKSVPRYGLFSACLCRRRAFKVSCKERAMSNMCSLKRGYTVTTYDYMANVTWSYSVKQDSLPLTLRGNSDLSPHPYHTKLDLVRGGVGSPGHGTPHPGRTWTGCTPWWTGASENIHYLPAVLRMLSVITVSITEVGVAFTYVHVVGDVDEVRVFYTGYLHSHGRWHRWGQSFLCCVLTSTW